MGTNGKKHYTADMGGVMEILGFNSDLEAFAKDVGRFEAKVLWANRNGFFYVLDRVTGQFLHAFKTAYGDAPDVEGAKQTLSDAGVNVTLTYLATGSRLVIGVDDVDKARAAMRSAGR